MRSLRWVRGTTAVVFLHLAFGGGTALGSFECLPGPAPGGLADWVGLVAFPSGRQPSGWSGSLAIGRPAAVENLAWSYAAGRWTGCGTSLCAEGFLLALEDLYRESLVGIWGRYGAISAGVRRWQVDWQGGSPRSGWTVCGLLVARHRQVEMRIATQDLPLGRRDAAAPERRLGATVGLRVHPSVIVEATLFRSQDEPGLQGALRWSVLPWVTLHQEVRFPDQMLQSGLEFDVGWAKPSVWVEPTSMLGLRIGVACALGSPPGGSSQRR